MSKYYARLSGANWGLGPSEYFNTIGGARLWAEQYGTTADVCDIYNNSTGKLVARHVRDTSMTHRGRWYKSPV